MSPCWWIIDHISVRFLSNGLLFRIGPSLWRNNSILYTVPYSCTKCAWRGKTMTNQSIPTCRHIPSKHIISYHIYARTIQWNAIIYVLGDCSSYFFWNHVTVYSLAHTFEHIYSNCCWIIATIFRQLPLVSRGSTHMLNRGMIANPSLPIEGAIVCWIGFCLGIRRLVPIFCYKNDFPQCC